MQKKSITLSVSLLAILFLFVAGMKTNLQAAGVGQTVYSVKIIDPNDRPRWIPHLGRKVVTVMYTDPDEKDVNDPLSKAIKARNYDKAKYQGIIIANCKDTYLPNAAIRAAARSKQMQFKDAVILFDVDHSVKNKWGLGDCDDMGVVIVIGKDKKIKYIKKIKN